ncbi:helicase-exonuclease AddAB subunit AddA [Paenibacillus eucommiae]|uniref:ATP-dependent helicase/nuclease subunit A n=1 Tax=Paenibacillus eucommiae TaxID=1355755 RepID=A0ABS4IZ34_9BACL|nr:helicase-exonuclease AddAB subunit AddA [Paenibacillus eucommiae]MBP1992859.1 ATP-dependent helicase/nuclease subunit A [Paenibacillus eucommiae]
MQTQQQKPSNSTWTDDQWKAIASGGQNMLVAAAAGSGKTAVLVERIIRRISDAWEPIDVDRLLVATFTKAAASEMKHRIREALEKELLREPKSQHLRKQLALMGRASITTLHSFCLEVIQRYFSLIHLDPGFRIANETEAELLRQDLLEELLEEYYAESKEESSFWRLVDSFSGERSDDALMQLVQKLYDVSRSHPWPEQWLRLMASMFGQRESNVSVYPLSDGSESVLYAAAASEPADLQVWQRSLIQDCLLELEGASDLIVQAQGLAGLPAGPTPYLGNLQEDLLLIEGLLRAAKGTWHNMYDAFQAYEFGKLKPCKGDSIDKDIQEQVKELRNQAKDRVNSIREELFGRTEEQFAAEIELLAPVLHTLVDLVLDFGNRYQAAKAEKGLIDFADLEHYTLQILCDPLSTPDELRPSQAAIEYRRQFAEVLLDEYQDTNRVQEAILELIARPKPGNRFMVGDVKQSIYGFRLAEPGLFLEKYKAYRSDASGEGLRIDLARNFRSRTQVVDAVNFLFKQLMNEKVGEIAYDERAELAYGAGYPASGSDCSVEMVLVDRTVDAAGLEDTEEVRASEDMEESEQDAAGAASEQDPALEAQELETAQLEARAICLQIKSLMGTGGSTEPFGVHDKKSGGTRPLNYRDIVILLRATSQWAPIFIEELKLQGIPAYADLSTGYFSATEVDVMLSLLKVIDNPYQDIPLAAAVRSPLVGLSADELAKIRAGAPGLLFYDAVLNYVSGMNEEELSEHPLSRFLNQLETWRTEARQGSLADLIWSIYRETGYYDFVGGLSGGVQRQANLRALYDRARQYESTTLRGLFRFLRFIERMQESGGDLGTARSLGEQEDVVRILSIHKSKGLEFPVVFVAGMAKQFNQRDLNAAFYLHKELGFGPRFVDTELRVSYPTLPSLAIRRRMKLEMLAEEMRILYVALTRAREKLILLGTVKSLDKLIQRWGRYLQRSEWMLPDFELAKARSYLDWLGPALLRHPDAGLWRARIGLQEMPLSELLEDPSAWKLTVLTPEQLVTADHTVESIPLDAERMEAVRSMEEVHTADDWKELLEQRLSWEYPHSSAQQMFSKTTVTEMKRLSAANRMEHEAELPAAKLFGLNELEGTAFFKSDGQGSLLRSSELRRPRFMEEKKLTSAERGTVIHAVMQNLPLDRQPSAEIIQAALDSMLERKLLTNAQYDSVDIEPILAYFATDLGQRMVAATKIEREVPFSFGLPAGEIYLAEAENTELQNETVLIQGVIDCLFEDEQGLVMIDYKTDSVQGRSIEELRERYRLQIGLYTRAVEHIWKRPLGGVYIYYFENALIVEM